MIAVDKHGRVILPTTGITAKVYAQEKRDQGMAKDLSLDQPSGAGLIWSTDFSPFSQVTMLSFSEYVPQAD